MKIHPVEAELFHVDRLRQTDGNEGNSRFSQFCKRAKRVFHFGCCLSHSDTRCDSSNAQQNVYTQLRPSIYGAAQCEPGYEGYRISKTWTAAGPPVSTFAVQSHTFPTQSQSFTAALTCRFSHWMSISIH